MRSRIFRRSKLDRRLARAPCRRCRRAGDRGPCPTRAAAAPGTAGARSRPGPWRRASARVAPEDLEDDGRAVHDLDPRRLLEVARLRGRDVVIDEDDLDGGVLRRRGRRPVVVVLALVLVVVIRRRWAGVVRGSFAFRVVVLILVAVVAMRGAPASAFKTAARACRSRSITRRRVHARGAPLIAASPSRRRRGRACARGGRARPPTTRTRRRRLRGGGRRRGRPACGMVVGHVCGASP